MSEIIKGQVQKLEKIFEINEKQAIKTITELKGYKFVQQIIHHNS